MYFIDYTIIVVLPPLKAMQFMVFVQTKNIHGAIGMSGMPLFTGG